MKAESTEIQTQKPIMSINGNPMYDFEEQLGEVLTAKDISQYFGLDEKTVRLYHRDLGGIRLGRRILFFEKEVINAVQKRSKMGSPSESKREEEGKALPEQEGGSSMGKRKSVKSRGDMAREDKHGVLV